MFGPQPWKRWSAGLVPLPPSSSGCRGGERERVLTNFLFLLFEMRLKGPANQRGFVGVREVKANVEEGGGGCLLAGLSLGGQLAFSADSSTVSPGDGQVSGCG